jgi:antirestriction protein ArdC
MIRAPKICGGSHIRAGLSGYVAELGAAFLAADLGLSIEPRPDHASYLASWIKVLQNDTRAIVQAAAHAERAVAYLHQLANPDDVREAA